MKIDKGDALEWAKFNGLGINHILKLPSLSSLNLVTGGGAHIINATTFDKVRNEAHGPSWRMIVHLTDNIEAYGVYPGGQNGNPGSKYYDTFVNTWAEGRYYRILFITKSEARKEPQMKWHISFLNS
jgi:penicillin amidase